MEYYDDLEKSLAMFKVLSSDLRISLLQLLLTEGPMSMNELAIRLHISGGALTGHIKKLQEQDLVRISVKSGQHRNQKICIPHIERMLFLLRAHTVVKNESIAELRVGQYSDFLIYPTCGLSTAQQIIGKVDDPLYFRSQAHFDADILWFGKGYVEYIVPNVLPKEQQITRISISMEISSEAPGSNNIWPSDLHFYLNGNLLGVWTSPGDYADVQGLFTPDWWLPNWNQYGLLKTLLIGELGTFMDDEKLSDVTVEDLHLTCRDILRFRISVPDFAKNVGGMTLFGKAFGNHNQDIVFRIRYKPLPDAEA